MLFKLNGYASKTVYFYLAEIDFRCCCVPILMRRLPIPATQWNINMATVRGAVRTSIVCSPFVISSSVSPAVLGCAAGCMRGKRSTLVGSRKT